MNIIETGQVEELADDWRNHYMEMVQALDRGLSRLAIETARQARLQAPAFTSDLIQGIQARRISALEHIAESTSGHAAAVEDGRKKGTWPNRQNIRDWVRLKRFGGPEDVDRIAFLVSRKIFRKGIKPNRYMKRSVDHVLKFASVILSNATTEGAKGLEALK
jgi:hypothetical protein